LGYVAHGLKNLAEQEQVCISFPYLDHNVLRTCLRVPLEEKMTPLELKPLLKKAFQDELPVSLLHRNTKGDYTSDVYEGMKTNFDWFKENFQQMCLADLGLVDLKKFQDCFDRLLIGAPVKLPEFHHTLSLEMWLRQDQNIGA
jgi:asparagine synthetase B (glutamine-hydrolysing)